ncbi:beta-glucosidase [Aureibaculum marinum]|uniref:Beta-glucosidase n=1 Tax=Aureibaculum marinum TaxID=2487930 RepID=A0A3N4NU59_9FLAO|nr:glucoamylase family protein [Aureibaculum marinum]RPD90693.1 beta-glucosidase [Aureibaculum marinum]
MQFDIKLNFIILTIAVIITSCGKDNLYTPPEPVNSDVTITDEELLELTQKETFKYFWNVAHSNSGAARERYFPEDPYHDANTVTTGGTGFGLMAILVGIERGYVTRSEAVERIEKILIFLDNADRFHGAWPHWLDGNTGKVKPFSTKDDGGDLVETAFLAQGLLCVKEYFKNGSETEKLLALKADELWKGVEWNWYTNDTNALFWHWSPNYGFDMNLKLNGHNETLITYILAAASPEYSISKEVYDAGWAMNGAIKSTVTQYGFPLVLNHVGASQYGGPLFFAHYSFLGLNPKNLSDQYGNYWQLNVSHSNINYQYCLENPKQFKGYGENCWGLTASYTRNADGSIGYKAHKPDNDSGVISPTAAISSIPYTPKESLKAMHYFYKNKDKLFGEAGFYDAFSPEYDWVAKAYLAIDQGPQIIMIENYRTGLLWSLFMQNDDIKKGLDKLGFSY